MFSVHRSMLITVRKNLLNVQIAAARSLLEKRYSGLLLVFPSVTLVYIL